MEVLRPPRLIDNMGYIRQELVKPITVNTWDIVGLYSQRGAAVQPLLARGEQDEERRAVRISPLARHGGGLRCQGPESGGGASGAEICARGLRLGEPVEWDEIL